MKLEALLIWKMVLHDEFGQIVFKWLMIKNLLFCRICHFWLKFTQKKLLATPISWLQMMLSEPMISHFLEASKYSMRKFFFTNMRIFFCWGGKVLKPLKSVLVKIGHKKSSNIAKEVWFLPKYAEWNYKSFKKKKSSLSLIELFLWPIFNKIDFRGFRIFPPLKKLYPNSSRKSCVQSICLLLNNEISYDSIALFVIKI